MLKKNRKKARRAATICRDSEKRISVRKINEALKTVPIPKEELPEILKLNLDRLGIGYADDGKSSENDR